MIAGVSTRAAALSAARAGVRVTALDAFADLDQHPAVTAHAVRLDSTDPFTAHALVDAARRLTADVVVYLSPLENHPRAVMRLAQGRTLWGNPPAVLRRVRDPRQVSDALTDAGLRAPLVRDAGDEPAARREWLQKPRASGGGRRVRPWAAGMRVPRTSYLQERIDGRPCSVVFVAANGRAVALALSYQIVGEAAFGATGFQYCGSILPGPDDPLLGASSALVPRAVQIAQTVTERFGLVGVNGVDFVAAGEYPVAVEVNPRWCASLELLDRESSVPVFAWHMGACADGMLPDVELHPAVRADARGKAVVFARTGVTVGETTPWLADDSIRDVPRPRTHIRKGCPVCTVLASGTDVSQCHAALVRRAEDVYAALARWSGAKNLRAGRSIR